MGIFLNNSIFKPPHPNLVQMHSKFFSDQTALFYLALRHHKRVSFLCTLFSNSEHLSFTVSHIFKNIITLEYLSFHPIFQLLHTLMCTYQQRILFFSNQTSHQVVMRRCWIGRADRYRVLVQQYWRAPRQCFSRIGSRLLLVQISHD